MNSVSCIVRPLGTAVAEARYALAAKDIATLDNATTVALSRLVAQQRSLDVTAANIANASTPGYRAQRMVFSDWMLKQRPGSAPPGGATLTYTQDRATYRDMQPGAISHTGNSLDLAIGTDGYFSMQTPTGVRLTRAGHFALGADGSIVDEAGNKLLDPLGKPLQVAAADTVLTIAADGTLSSENGQIGKIAVVQPADPQKLQGEGQRLFAAGATTTTAVAAPKLSQGTVEESNVQPTVELTRMMNDLREFQFVTQFIQSEGDRQQSAIDKIIQKAP